jgi:hypothetical protein
VVVDPNHTERRDDIYYRRMELDACHDRLRGLLIPIIQREERTHTIEGWHLTPALVASGALDPSHTEKRNNKWKDGMCRKLCYLEELSILLIQREERTHRRMEHAACLATSGVLDPSLTERRENI